MKLIHRLAYYLGGFAIGLVILFFFLGGKRASCDYSPNARTLKNIRIKERILSQEVIESLEKHNLDSSTISSILQDGKVRFSESETSLDSCRLYLIEKSIKAKKIKIKVENCESQAKINSVVIED